MVDLRQTPQYACYMDAIGWKVIWEDGVKYFFKKVPLLGYVMKLQRPEEIHLNDIVKLASQYKCFSIIVEPKDDLQATQLKGAGFRLNKSPYLPSKTIHIDVTKSDEALLKAMHHKSRYNIKLAQKCGVEVHSSDDIEKFANFWQQCAKKQRNMFLSQKKEILEIYKAFDKNAELLFAYCTPKHKELVSHYDENGFPITHDEHNLMEHELIAAILLLHTKNISYYMYAASSDEGKKNFAPTYLVWEALQKSKEKGSHYFDFEGIFDDRFPLPTWKGFTKFKKTFGGEEIIYPGCYTKLRFPV